MMQIRRLTEDGLRIFEHWLEGGEGDDPPAVLLNGATETEPCLDESVDETQQFLSRYEFGRYLTSVLKGRELHELLSLEYDGMWAWIAVVYFALLKKNKKAGRGRFQSSEHFIVRRKGAKGSLAYRQAPRICYELVAVHGEHAKVCLLRGMDTFGDMAEQLASRNYLATNKALFETAAKLYLRDGGAALARGAASYPVKPSKRKASDRRGYGGMRRLETRLKRLQLTYDTEAMTADQMVALLPKEFAGYLPKTAQ